MTTKAQRLRKKRAKRRLADLRKLSRRGYWGKISRAMKANAIQAVYELPRFRMKGFHKLSYVTVEELMCLDEH